MSTGRATQNLPPKCPDRPLAPRGPVLAVGPFHWQLEHRVYTARGYGALTDHLP